MAMTVHPAVSRVSYRRWVGQVLLFAAGAAIGGLVTYGLARAVYLVLAESVSPTLWMALCTVLIGLAVAKQGGLDAPVPYRGQAQVPEWLRWMVLPEFAAAIYGAELGFGFLTRFTFATHMAFVLMLAGVGNPGTAVIVVCVYGCAKAIVILAAVTGPSETKCQTRFMQRLPTSGAGVLRLTNAVLAIAAVVVIFETAVR